MTHIWLKLIDPWQEGIMPRYCQLVLFDEPPMKMRDVYQHIIYPHDDIKAQQVIRELERRGVADRMDHTSVGPHHVFACGEGKPTPQCGCGRWATQLCDEPVGKGKTCDLPLCRHCTFRPYDDEDIDLCQLHKHRHMTRAGDV
jgi:hypothetical protein